MTKIIHLLSCNGLNMQNLCIHMVCLNASVNGYYQNFSQLLSDKIIVTKTGPQIKVTPILSLCLINTSP
jgi:hypothetical protein